MLLLVVVVFGSEVTCFLEIIISGFMHMYIMRVCAFVPGNMVVPIVRRQMYMYLEMPLKMICCICVFQDG